MNNATSISISGIIPALALTVNLSKPHRRLLATGAVMVVVMVVLLTLVVRQTNPIIDLETAKARWQAASITDYRIAVEFQRPYLTCVQDFEVRGVNVGFKHKDTCRIGGAITGQPAANWPTVDNLFARIEDAQTNPQCGPNGCICDGPIVLDVAYDPELGYPQQITYTLRQDLRTGNLEYWLAVLNGTLANCPQVTYIGQTIHVVTLEALAPLADQLSEATPEIGIGSAIKPEITPETTPVPSN